MYNFTLKKALLTSNSTISMSTVASVAWIAFMSHIWPMAKKSSYNRLYVIDRIPSLPILLCNNAPLLLHLYRCGTSIDALRLHQYMHQGWIANKAVQGTCENYICIERGALPRDPKACMFWGSNKVFFWIVYICGGVCLKRIKFASSV